MEHAVIAFVEVESVISTQLICYIERIFVSLQQPLVAML